MNKIIAIVIIFALTFTTLGATSAFAENQTYKLGDVDLDGEITVKDATLIQKFLVTYPLDKSADYIINSTQKFLADVDEDGISITCATQIQKYAAQIQQDTRVGEMTEILPLPEYKVSEIKTEPTGSKIEFTQTLLCHRQVPIEGVPNDSTTILTSTNANTYNLCGTELENRYNKSYFENKALIVMSFWGSSSIPYKANQVFIKDDKLQIDYTMFFPTSGAVNDDIVNYCLYIEVDRADVANISQIELYKQVQNY